MPSTYVLYKEINNLEEFAMIAGTDYTLVFTVYDQDGVLQNIGGATVKWTLSPFGQSTNILQINGTILDDNRFEVVIPAASTQNLSGKYTQQPVIRSFYGQQFIPAQGTILIIPQTPIT